MIASQSLTVSFSIKQNKMIVSSNLVPSWLSVLLSEKFFNACIIHEKERKNEKNMYCLDCCVSLCPHCCEPHQSHRLLKIRRYVYQDVINLSDAAKLIDCALVQSYTSNSAKVVFLNQRPLPKNYSSHGKVCITCDRNLQDAFFYCSLSCKIDHVMKTEGDLSQHLRECNSMAPPDPNSDDGLRTPNSVLEPTGSVTPVRTSSGSGGYGELGCMALACTATTEIVRKKRSSLLREACRPVVSPVSEISAGRRKRGTPNRAPLL